MPFDRLRDLLQAMFSEVNIANQPAESVDLWNRYGEAITPLLAASSVRDEFVSLGGSMWLPRSIEATRILGQLRQRFTPTDIGRSLVGRIRAEAIIRQRPARTVSRSMLEGDVRAIAELTPPYFSHFTEFQVDGWKRVLAALNHRQDLIITAPTGSGKTEVFLLPLVHDIARAIASKAKMTPRYILLYPRVPLLKDQLIRVFRGVASAQRMIQHQRGMPVLSQENAIIVGIQFAGIRASLATTLQNEDIVDRDGIFRLIEQCPVCSHGHLQLVRKTQHLAHVRCTEDGCDADYWLSLGRNEHTTTMAHILVTTAESLDRFCLDASGRNDKYLRSISGIVFDEVHLYASLYGVHIANLLRRIEERREGVPLAKIAASATVSNPSRFAAKLFHAPRPEKVVTHSADDYPLDASGLEVVYFLQSPDDEQARGPAPTLIQSVMALGHGLLNPDDRMLLFTESVDMAGRLEQQINNAEHARWRDQGVARGLWEFRTRLGALAFHGTMCPGTDPASCSTLYAGGECWRGVRAGDRCCEIGSPVRETPLQIVQVTSQQPGLFWQGDVVVATSTLEVGVDDERIRATVHYRPPRTIFSFLQRRGRAGRAADDIAYTVLVLGNTPSDNFYFFRRHRLLHGSYELPLNPDNSIIRAMHDRLEAERKVMASYIAEAHNIPVGIWRWIRDMLLGCPLLMQLYGVKLSGLDGRSLDYQRAVIKRWVADERAALESYLSLQWLLREIKDELPESIANDANEAIDYVESYVRARSVTQEEIGARLESIAAKLSHLRFQEKNTEIRSHLKLLEDRLEQVWDAVLHQANTIEPRFAYALYDFFQTAGRLFSADWILNSSPDALKIMLQAMFVLHHALQDGDEAETCRARAPYYIPDSYFQELKPVYVDVRRSDQTERKLDQLDASNLETLLIPYKPVYRYYPHPLLSVVDTVHSEEWVSAPNDLGERVVTLRLTADGVRRNDALYPQKVYVKPLKSDGEGEQIVKLCPSCFALHHIQQVRSCHPGAQLIPVSLFAEPIVSRRFDAQTQWRISRSMNFLERVYAATTLYGSQVEAQIMTWNPAERRYEHTRRSYAFEARYQTPVEYDMTSKGIAWDLSDVIQEILQNDALRHDVERVQIPLRPAPIAKRLTAELVLHTAAHMLHRAVSAISGVNEQTLEYSWHTENNRVAVWERYEGGAGISEVFADALRTNPTAIYRELLGTILCPVQLAEETTSIDPATLAERLSAEWSLSAQDATLQETIHEAQAEQETRRRQAAEEQKTVCLPPAGHDGCPACIHTTYCVHRQEQAVEVSRMVGATLLGSFVRQTTREETQALTQEAIGGNFSAPALLDADPAADTYHVLLL